MRRRDWLKLIGVTLAAASPLAPGVARAVLGGTHTPRGPVGAKNLAQLRGGETDPVIDGRNFTGRAGAAYRAAAEIPDLLDQLYCYCECERSIGHRSLKSCFVDLHGANCGICQEEALLAWRLNRAGRSVLEIRNEVDRVFLTR